MVKLFSFKEKKDVQVRRVAVQVLKHMGSTAADLKEKGYSAVDLMSGGYESDLHTLGFSASELLMAGFQVRIYVNTGNRRSGRPL